MLDPFPFPPPEGLGKAIKPYADYLGLKTLPLHFHEVVFAFILYHVTNRYISPTLSKRFCPNIYNSFNARTKLNWDVHVVSFVQSTLINLLALYVMFFEKERGTMDWQDRVYGYTGASGLIQGFATGYFVWDLLITLQHLNIFGIGMLAHAVSALFVFSLGFRPIFNYYGPVFILYELSSPFLNIHWFCDKLNLTGTKIQLYNGIALLVTFFFCRLVWGSYQSVAVFTDVYRAIKEGTYTPFTPFIEEAKPPFFDTSLYDAQTELYRFAEQKTMPLWLAACYLASNLTLNGLNWYWFGKMIATIRKRFDPPFGTRRPEKKEEKEHMLVEGIDVETDSEAEALLDESGMPTQVKPKKATGVDLNDQYPVVHKKKHKDGSETIEVQKKTVRTRRRG